MTPQQPVSEHDRQVFQQDGVVRVRNLVDADALNILRQGVEQVMADPDAGFTKDVAQDGNKTGRFYSEVFASKRNALLQGFIRGSSLGPVAAYLMESNEVRFFNDHLLVKEPGTDAPTPWHQDLPYFPCRGTQVCSAWIALDEVSKDTGAMSFVVGSHKTGKQYQPENFGTGELYAGKRFDGPVPDIDGQPNEFETVCYELAPGDVTFHHGLTLHGAKGNTSLEKRRRGYSIRLVGDDGRWQRTERPQRGFKSLDHNAPLDDPFYTLLWPRL